MTHAMAARTDQALAHARNGVDHAIDHATDNTAGYVRRRRQMSVAVELLAEGYVHCICAGLAVAEAVLRLVERDGQAPADDPAAPIPYVPALDTIPRADDYPGFGG